MKNPNRDWRMEKVCYFEGDRARRRNKFFKSKKSYSNFFTGRRSGSDQRTQNLLLLLMHHIFGERKKFAAKGAAFVQTLTLIRILFLPTGESDYNCKVNGVDIKQQLLYFGPNFVEIPFMSLCPSVQRKTILNKHLATLCKVILVLRSCCHRINCLAE